MKHLNSIALFGLLIALRSASIAHGAEQPASNQPCTLAKTVLKQQGLLDPQMAMLPNGDSFAAANGDLKLVLACGLSSDEIYTFSRLLARSGTGLLVFKGDETPERVFEQLSDRLGISYHLANPEAAGGEHPTYVFTAQGPASKEARITLNVPGGTPGASFRRKGSDSGKGQISGGIGDLYQLAKANDPDLGRTQARVVGSMADTDVVRAGYHPKVNASAGISQIDQTVLNYPTVDAATGTTSTTSHSGVFGYTYDVSATMPLLHLSTSHYLSSAKASLRGEEAGVSAAKQNLMVKLVDAYFSILRGNTNQLIARDELARVKQVLEQAQAFLKAGTGDIIAVYEAKARLDGVVAELDNADSTLKLAQQKLSGMVGQPVATVADYLHLQPTEATPDDIDWWLATMEKQDPQVRQARESLNQSLEQTKATRADYYPVIDSSAGYDVNKGSAFLPNVETHQWHVGATVSVALYSGGETAARVRRAIATEDERRYQLEATLEQRRENLKQSFLNLRYNVSLIRALKQKEASYAIQLNAIKKGRSLGTRTAIDLLNAEQAYSTANKDLRNALYDNVVKVIQLKAAAGILDEADLSGA